MPVNNGTYQDATLPAMSALGTPRLSHQQSADVANATSATCHVDTRPCHINNEPQKLENLKKIKSCERV